MRTLVVFYSRKGATKRIAVMIAEQLDADTYEIREQDRKRGLMRRVTSVLSRRIAIVPYEGSLGSYDRVVLCTPIKHGRIALPMCAFLTAYGKTISRVVYVFVKRVMSRDYPECITAMDELIGRTFESAIFLNASNEDALHDIKKFVNNLAT